MLPRSRSIHLSPCLKEHKPPIMRLGGEDRNPTRLVPVWYHMGTTKCCCPKALPVGVLSLAGLVNRVTPPYPHPPPPIPTQPASRWVGRARLVSSLSRLLLSSATVGSSLNGPGRAAVGAAVKPPDESFRRLEITPTTALPVHGPADLRVGAPGGRSKLARQPRSLHTNYTLGRALLLTCSGYYEVPYDTTCSC